MQSIRDGSATKFAGGPGTEQTVEYYNEILTTSPVAVVLMVHLVKGRQYSAYTMYEPH